METKEIVLKNIEHVGKEIVRICEKSPCSYEKESYNNVLHEYRIAWVAINRGENPLEILNVLCEKTDYCAQTGMLITVKNILTGKGSEYYGLTNGLQVRYIAHTRYIWIQ